LLDETQVIRFRNEASAAARLEHPNIVSVYEVGQAQGVHYYAMRLIEGQNLAQVLAGRSQQSISDELESPSSPLRGLAEATVSVTDRARLTAQIGIQAAKALAYAHAAGVVHRDIKPSNLLLDTTGHLWITDFGLARVGMDHGLTATGNVVGTLKYMSPEQAAGGELGVDHRTDLFSLGATLFEVLTGRPMRVAALGPELLHEVAGGAPPRFGREYHRVALDLQTIISKCTEKEATHRYGSADELAYDLQAFLEHRPIRAQPPTWSERFLKWTRRNPTTTKWLAGSAAAIALLVVSAAVLISNERQSRFFEQKLREQQQVQLDAELLRARIDRYTTQIQLARRHWDGLEFRSSQLCDTIWANAFRSQVKATCVALNGITCKHWLTVSLNR
jgi:serine/threonine protein kinase